MQDGAGLTISEIAALDLLKRLRLIDARVGIKNSRIAFDVALLFYGAGLQGAGLQGAGLQGAGLQGAGLQGAGPALSVDQIADMTQYSGPTVRLVLKRLMNHGNVVSGRRLGKTQFYMLTAAGRAAFHEYIAALEAFRAGPAPPA